MKLTFLTFNVSGVLVASQRALTMALIDQNVTRNSSIVNVRCDDVTIQSVNGSWMLATGADVVEARLEHLLIDRWTMTRAGLAVCLAIASLIVNRLLLREVLHRQLTDSNTQVSRLTPCC